MKNIDATRGQGFGIFCCFSKAFLRPDDVVAG
jgi:hypothetical protein